MTKYLLLLLLPLLSYSQRQTLDQQLFSSYEDYKEASLDKRRFKHQDIQPLIDSLETKNEFEITLLGESIQGRSIKMISLGEGDIDVLLWSQMHGDESTATMAMFDILNYVQKHKTILKNLRVHMIPMLNPDGAEVFSRRNAIGIDINRDALRLQSPESILLKNTRDSLKADFGFNLHDQSKYYNAQKTAKPATISFLAPAYNFEKDINQTRGDAMRIIAHMNKIIQRYAKGQVGRYSDEFEPRAFGDNMQKWGTSTILIESGGQFDDPEKQFIRKLNYVSILSALESISTKGYESSTLDQYLSIPRNDRKLYDLKIERLKFSYLGLDFEVDLGINHYEIENNDHSQFFYLGKIVDVGDLSTHHGYETLNAEGYEYKVGETYPKILDDFEAFRNLDFADLLKQGYTSVSISNMPSEIKFTPMPMNIIDVEKIMIPKSNSIPDSPVKLGSDATFLLKKNEAVVYAVINGFVYYLSENKNGVKNGVVK
ncbi:M14 family zinc carboxypeptidase [Lutimonas sp.]|uniref:M14 family zinc carboxypeptidase n=1 Tax=Lutimonas sp. TaxID=1872403 RepID=UPI003D9BF3CE